jgi:hypothetical protein
MMDDCNETALTPLRKSSIAVLSSRVENRQLSAMPREELFLVLHQSYTVDLRARQSGSNNLSNAAQKRGE